MTQDQTKVNSHCMCKNQHNLSIWLISIKINGLSDKPDNSNTVKPWIVYFTSNSTMIHLDFKDIWLAFSRDASCEASRIF